jgi:hypothetical protein
MTFLTAARPSPMWTDGQHRPARPSWDCAHCRAPWPCPAARTTMVAECLTAGSRIPLAVHLTGLWQVALHDVDADHVRTLYQQMFGWLRSATRPVQVDASRSRHPALASREHRRQSRDRSGSSP